MENIQAKEAFLKTEYTRLLAQLDPNTPPIWGKMNVQQMIEHMGDYIRISNGKDVVELVIPSEHVPRALAFLESEKPFRENTPNQLLPDIPLPPKMELKEAIERVQKELDDFFEVYSDNPSKKVPTPFFGELDYEHNIQLLHKHATHHLRQFGVN